MAKAHKAGHNKHLQVLACSGLLFQCLQDSTVKLTNSLTRNHSINFFRASRHKALGNAFLTQARNRQLLSNLLKLCYNSPPSLSYLNYSTRSVKFEDRLRPDGVLLVSSPNSVSTFGRAYLPCCPLASIIHYILLNNLFSSKWAVRTIH